MPTITKSNLKFLQNIAKNNNREWFANHKDEYKLHLEDTREFSEALLKEMQKHDNIETPSGKKALHRIYRDVRFSKDKSPYKNNWGISFKRATNLLRGSYYLHIQPGGNSFVGGGFWAPEKEDLLRIRQDIAEDDTALRKIINSKSFKSTFGTLKGDQLKTSPKGFDKNHPAVDLLRYKQFLITKSFTDEEVLAKDFYKKVSDTFKKMRPFFDYMSESVTTDSNGELVV